MTQFILEQGPQETSSQIYNRTDIFNIPERGYIKMMFLKITVYYDVPLISNIPKSTMPAFELHDYIQLESDAVPFCFDNHVYGQCRVSQLSYDNFSQVKNAASIVGAVTKNNPKTVIRPLFFTAFDNGNKILATDNLTVRAITRSSYELMGFSEPLSRLDVRLKIVYEQVPEFIERPLSNTYNARAYPSIPIADGLTYYRLKLNCPFEIISIMFMIKNNAFNYKIDSIKLTYPNNEYGLYENNTDFDLTSTGSMEHNDSTYVISFATRTNSDGVIRTNKSYNPTVAEINFGPTAAASTVLYYIIEYKSYLEYSDGRIVEKIKDSTK